MNDTRQCIEISKPVDRSDVEAQGQRAVDHGIAHSFTIEEKDDHYLLCLNLVVID